MTRSAQKGWSALSRALELIEGLGLSDIDVKLVVTVPGSKVRLVIDVDDLSMKLESPSEKKEAT